MIEADGFQEPFCKLKYIYTIYKRLGENKQVKSVCFKPSVSMSCVVLIMHVPTYPQGTYGDGHLCTHVYGWMWEQLLHSITGLVWGVKLSRTSQLCPIQHIVWARGVWVAGAMSDVIW